MCKTCRFSACEDEKTPVNLTDITTDIVSLTALVVVLLCGGCGVAYLIKRSFAFSLPVFSLALMLVLFLASFARNITVGFTLGIALSAALGLIALYGIFFADDRQWYRRAIFNHGMLAFVLLALFCLVINHSREVFYDDDLHYWARSVREMLRLNDVVARHPQSMVYGLEKPPTTSLFLYFFARLSRSSVDFPLFVALQMLTFSFLLPLFDSIKEEDMPSSKWLRFVALLILIPCLLVVFNFKYYFSNYSMLLIDLLLSVEVAFGLYCIAMARLPVGLETALLGLLCAVLAVQKDTGLLLVVCVLMLAVGVRGLLRRRAELRDNKDPSPTLALTVLQMGVMLTSLLTTFLLWEAVVDAFL